MPDRAQVALEMLHVHRVEPDQRRVQSDVELGHPFSQDKRSAVAGDDLFELVQRPEDGDDVLVVFLLRGREAGFVHARVYVALHPFADAIDLGTEGCRVEVYARDVGWENAVERGGEPSQEFSAFLLIWDQHYSDFF